MQNKDEHAVNVVQVANDVCDKDVTFKKYNFLKNKLVHRLMLLKKLMMQLKV